MIEAVERELAAYRGAQVQVVRVRVGALRQVVPEIMTFCFEAATRDTPLGGTRLELEEVPARARCRSCRAEFAVSEDWFECPQCHELGAEVLAGRELDLVGIELEEVSAV
jgi:hydrogenase nickel incorporation protein HypA/HybF